ncbi:MAG: SufE family protein [Candidatus Limnocylindrus sp.]
MSESTAAQLPPGLAAVAAEFADTPRELRPELLLEYAARLKPLPEPYASREDLMERVEECQSPLFVIAEIQDNVVSIHATAPRESPTTRAFASIMQLGLSGLTPAEVLAVPASAPLQLGLTELVSPLRMRGATGLLARIQRQVRAATIA